MLKSTNFCIIIYKFLYLKLQLVYDDVKYFAEIRIISASPYPPTKAMGAAMLGGGVSAERRYNKDAASVTIQIIADSSMLQDIMMMFSNPMLAGADGGKMEKIAGEKAIVNYKEQQKNGKINLVIANRFLVTVEGDGASLADLKAYTAKIDYKKLAALQ